MQKTIKIGTRDSQLAMWQANKVRKELEELEYECEIVPIKSTGDLDLDTPLHELGITGVFTKNLDLAMLSGEIDIAVHSLKDVPTVLPNGIVQAAVLKRGNVNDTLVFKNNEEFLGSKEALIATGSLRRRAQWLSRFPTHTITDLRGNVNSRLQKLEDNEDWNGAIFAAAGIGRIGRRPEEAVNLEWMVPAPAQGALMIVGKSDDMELNKKVNRLNHHESQLAVSIERAFLKTLEGGCSAPIGALAIVTGNKVRFTGIINSLDGHTELKIEKTSEDAKGRVKYSIQ